MKITCLITILFVVTSLISCAAIDRASGVSQARELHKNGTSAEATILKVWDTGVKVNEDPVVGFLLEVRSPEIDTYQAETKLRISIVHIPQYQPGAVVPVRYDPKNPSRVSLDIYEF